MAPPAMFFNSIPFFVFLGIVLLLYFILNKKAQNALLLLASYYFYGSWDWRFLVLLWFTTGVDYFCSQAIESQTNLKTKKLLLLLSISGNLILLGFFKYFNFFMESFRVLLSTLHLPTSTWSLQIILPVGLSFYTLQSMGYVIDVYYGREKACRNLLHFALYVCYFPHLVAGPIQRGKDLLPQIEGERRVRLEDLWSGSFLILYGLFLKVVIADNLSPLVDEVFSEPSSHSSIQLLLGVYAFAFQIYCDFSGYSTIASGVSQIMGIHLIRNFNVPYFATSLEEFWKRWHIALSSWLRDHLYIPLGGNRNGKTARNLLITMVLGGLWHGANWTMAIWGLLHGCYLILWKGLRERIPTSPSNKRLKQILSALLVFHLVCLAWIFFRSPNLLAAERYLGYLVKNHSESEFFRRDLLAVGLIMITIGLDWLQHSAGSMYFTQRWRVSSRSFLYAFFLLALWVAGGHRNEPFIYFQF